MMFDAVAWYVSDQIPDCCVARLCWILKRAQKENNNLHTVPNKSLIFIKDLIIIWGVIMKVIAIISDCYKTVIIHIITGIWKCSQHAKVRWKKAQVAWQPNYLKEETRQTVTSITIYRRSIWVNFTLPYLPYCAQLFSATEINQNYMCMHSQFFLPIRWITSFLYSCLIYIWPDHLAACSLASDL